MKKAIRILVLILSFASCKKSEKATQMIHADWLIGTWENKSEQGTLIEIWKKTNDSIYNGQCYFIKSKDTLHFETIQLKQTGGRLNYITTVKGQNNDKAVAFKLTNETKKQITFENPNHDYPKKIIYNLITKDSLVAVISGIQQGKLSSEQFSMKKSK
ncbi:DUF6265 family protein [Flavobacterium psychrotolerans]|uniref:DUF6265 domain-containing protein n=1 Tax=Flavobacterium psychrotolerans TaxID=2169410 RepID=A0A2U1JQJ6_9FLAO|nr:DUF6265 family protein [Flavobacterium psychrotolerans]PWA07460.1 hypothetical protein DB895_01725 [Flavobacterium psychrotolerans]